MNRAITTVLVTTTLALGACSGSFAMRDATSYQADTRTMLQGAGDQVKACYDRALAQDESVSGTVVVNFKVQAETGMVTEAMVDEAESTAPASLSDCVLGTLDGLVLEPAAENEGQATFRWNFSPRG